MVAFWKYFLNKVLKRKDLESKLQPFYFNLIICIEVIFYSNFLLCGVDISGVLLIKDMFFKQLIIF